MEKKEVFISYKSEEFDDALWVKNTLEDNGISCWMAPMSISGGASYASEIPSAIENCKVFVLILSEKVQESKWVPRELDQAINAEKLIMPFMIENCSLKDEFKFYLSNVQRYYAYLDKEATMKKMLAEIKSILGIVDPEPEEDHTPVLQPEKDKVVPPAKKAKKKSGRPATKSKRLGRVLGIIAAGVACLAAIVTLSVVLQAKQRVVFADTTYKKSDYSITVEGKKITAADMAELVKFEDLSFIHINNCSFKTDDLSAISAHDLLSLEITDCQLTDTQLKSLDFKSLEKLTELNLGGNKKLTDLTVVGATSDTLEKLYINNVSVTTLDWLKDFSKLTHLSIDNLGVSDLNPLKEMAYLENISANGNGIETLDGLENTSVLKEVYLNDNRLTDVSQLANSADTLKTLYLDNNLISDLSAISGCSAISQLSANSNQLTSLEWSDSWEMLTSLSLAKNNIKSTDGITKGKALTYLDLSDNKLTKVEGVAFETDGYITANFSNNKIASAVLPTDCYFSTLALHGNPLKSSSFLEGTDGSNISFDYFDALDVTVLETSEFNYIYLIDCPTNKRVEIEQASSVVRLVTADEADNALFGQNN